VSYNIPESKPILKALFANDNKIRTLYYNVDVSGNIFAHKRKLEKQQLIK